MTAAAKEENQFCLFVGRDIDDYGLDPYEFRLYARISRRAGSGEAWESIANMARACCMSLSRARISLQLLELAGLIESIERPGYSTLRRLTPQHKWVSPERLQELRKFIRYPKSPTPTKSDRGTKSDTPIKSSSTPLSNLIPLPLSNLVDEGTPSEVNPNKVFPISPFTPKAEKSGEEEKAKKENSQSTISGSSLLNLSGQIAQLLENALKPAIATLIAETKQALLEMKAPKEASRKETETPSKLKQQVKTCQADESTRSPQILEELARLVDESVESLRRNPNLSNALAEYSEGVSDAMLYFKQAVATWKKKPGLGLFISALRRKLKPVPTAPGGGWGEWANEAVKRQLMEYSQSWSGDIMVHFVGGLQRLWSEVRNLEWSEIEALVAAPHPQGCLS